MDVVVREDKDFYRISGFDKKNLGELKSALNNRRLRLKPPKAEDRTKTEPANKAGAERAAKNNNADQHLDRSDRSDRADRKEGDRRNRDKFIKDKSADRRSASEKNENAAERADRKDRNDRNDRSDRNDRRNDRAGADGRGNDEAR